MLFSRELGAATVDRVAGLILDRKFAWPAEDLYAGIGQALACDARLTSPGSRHGEPDEQDYRDFLARMAQRLDSLRPWPASRQRSGLMRGAE